MSDIFELGVKHASGANLPPRDGPSDAGGAAAETGATGTPTNLAERHATTSRAGPGTKKVDWVQGFRRLAGGQAKTAGILDAIARSRR